MKRRVMENIDGGEVVFQVEVGSSSTGERQFQDGLMTHNGKGDPIEWNCEYLWIDEKIKEIVEFLGDKNDGEHWEYILDRVGLLEQVSKQYMKGEFFIQETTDTSSFLTYLNIYWKEMKRISDWIIG